MQEEEKNNVIPEAASTDTPPIEAPAEATEAAEQVAEQTAGQPAEGQKGQAAETEAIADRVRVISPMRLVLKRFFRSRLCVAGLIMFVFLLVFSFLGPAFISWSEEEVDRSGTGVSYSYHSMEVQDDEGNKYTVYSDTEVKSAINNHALPFSYSNDENPRLHVLGTDQNGRDIFVRLMYGGRLSILLSFLVVLIYTIIGVVLGGLAGYFGKWVDMVIMRIVDILNCIPSLPILLIIGAILESAGIDASIRIYIMMACLALLSWTGVARLVRGQILFLREQEYIVAAEALGLSPMRKIFRHLVPNVMPQLIVSMTLGLGSIILYEATLSFIGLGVPPEAASWGQMVQSAVSDTAILNYYVECWLPAGIMIILAVLAFNFIGDGLRDALDPKMKR